MNAKALALAEILMDIEKELRELRLWDAVAPSAEALSSSQPFAVDTLTFPQWLQFIFLPRLYFLLEQQAALPTQCGVAPMAEEYFQVLQLHSAPIIAHLHKIDHLLSEN
ncbi:MAG TPA: YqcC family protein [Cellvibrio sp.]|nr:YqcC family protein [Cellvibrio sp.]